MLPKMVGMVKGRRAQESQAQSHSGSSASSDKSSSEGYQDENPEDDLENIQPSLCLFCDKTFQSRAKELFAHCAKEHDFPWERVTGKDGLNLDFYGKIKLINFLRKNPTTPITALSHDLFGSDEYLKPTLEDDALLFDLDDADDDTHEEEEEKVVFKGKGPAHTADNEVEALRKQLAELEAQFTAYKNEVRDNFLKNAEKRETKETGPSRTKVGADGKEERDDDTHYFNSYSGNDIHETMLKDTVRTDSYRDFIYENKHIFKDKVVLDVGCGTGILSMFCAKAGAKKVIAVDNSEIIDKARANVFENGLDRQITLLRGKIEEVILPVKQVDIIVSEWMGYCLLYEAMLDSVLYARDRYLAPDGLMVPSVCKLLIAAVHDNDYINDNVTFWSNVYGFRMTAMQEKITEDVVINYLPKTSLASRPAVFLDLPLHEIQKDELSFTAPFELEINETVESLDAFVIYFDNYFLTNRGKVSNESLAETWKGDGISFTTGPGGKETHWRQGVFLVEKRSGLLRQGEKLKGEITYRKRKENSRELEIDIKWKTHAGEEKQLWYMR